jgi:uncharacterized membrane protein
VRRTFFGRWRSNFLTGLAVSLPAVISIAAFVWLFSTLTGFTDALLFFLPLFLKKSAIYQNGQNGAMFWYWSALAFALAIVLISLVGLLARYYIGKKVIDWTDRLLMQVPLLNKFYSAIKQVNESFAGSKHSFKTVVLVEFPGPGNYSVGFITNEETASLQKMTGQTLISVFIPTTPNPTSGFLVLFPADRIKRLDISVADGIKYVVSLGAISPDSLPSRQK